MYKLQFPPNVHYLIDILEEDGYEAYIVGGCVRDSLINKNPNDWDICTSAKPQEVIDLLECYDDIEVIPTGLKHGTITAHVNGENYEITTYRVDGEYSDNRRPDSVMFVGDVESDLSRRDFTINAMAYSNIGTLIDPFDGYRDLLRGIIRCVGDPYDRFNEDGLRILRALRFASTYGFKIEDYTAKAIHENKDLLKNISAERIQSELVKLLCGKGALDILLNYKDIMAVIIPELESCIGFEQRSIFHKYDVYEHIVRAVAGYRGNDISIKMALLLHDIGQPQCFTVDAMNDGHFYGHAVISSSIAADVMRRLRYDSKTTNEVLDLVLYHDADIQPNNRAVRRWLNKIGLERLEKLMIVREYDVYAQSHVNQFSRVDKCFNVVDLAREIVQNQQCFQIKDLVVNGRDIISIGFDEGPGVGKALNHILDKVIDGELENESDALLNEASKFYKELLLKGEL